jgi:metal-responsive CopG/Arc/MetJ family transcriptional regulator
MYVAIMAARSIQISVDEELLREIDRRPETKREGRSAVIRSALRLYLQRKQKDSTDEQYARAYGARKARETSEFDALLDEQAWPDER